MDIRVVQSVLDWFDKYQPVETPEEARAYVGLYERLIAEEVAEKIEAIRNNDFEEFLDGVADEIWVTMGRHYFASKALGHTREMSEDYIQDLVYLSDASSLFGEYMLDAMIETIAESNWTKSLEQQTEGEKKGKIIKGPDFKKPDWKSFFKKINEGRFEFGSSVTTVK